LSACSTVDSTAALTTMSAPLALNEPFSSPRRSILRSMSGMILASTCALIFSSTGSRGRSLAAAASSSFRSSFGRSSRVFRPLALICSSTYLTYLKIEKKKKKSQKKKTTQI
jgi:hypothetical protein